MHDMHEAPSHDFRDTAGPHMPGSDPDCKNSAQLVRPGAQRAVVIGLPHGQRRAQKPRLLGWVGQPGAGATQWHSLECPVQGRGGEGLQGDLCQWLQSSEDIWRHSVRGRCNKISALQVGNSCPSWRRSSPEEDDEAVQLLACRTAPCARNNGCQGCQEQDACTPVQYVEQWQICHKRALHEGC